jgi:chorismate mutase/prephenate dehydratase
MDLDELRAKIDEIDDKLLELFNERMELVHKVGELKNTTNSPIYRPEREQSILNRLKKKNRGKLTNQAIDALFLELFSVSRNMERPERVAFLGPEASFTHQAANIKFGATSEYLPIRTIKGVFREVNRGSAKFGVVPIENSSNGFVAETLNSLINYNLKIISEVFVDIHHSLATTCESIKDIKRLYSKDIAFWQCENFLQDVGLDEVEHVLVESTAKAAKLAKEDREGGAICSIIAAKLYNLPVLFENIEDQENNRTRFFIISNFDNLPSGQDKTSIIANLPNRPGSLVEFLNDFNSAKINLTKIKSHIVRGESIFFIDFDGHKDDKRVKEVLDKHKSAVKILGSYVKESDDI